jgi:hypothetical protein
MIACGTFIFFSSVILYLMIYIGICILKYKQKRTRAKPDTPQKISIKKIPLCFQAIINF